MSPLHREPGRLTGILLASALVLSALLAGVAAPADAAGPKPKATCPAGGTVVPAPAAGGSVTVSQTTGLVNQVVHVCWQGFTPSTDLVLGGSTMNPVRVYQCNADPRGPEDCYGSSLYNGQANTGGAVNQPDGPSNQLTTVTSPDSTGAVDIEVRTKLESSTLGCSSTKACSLVVVPNYGDPADPANASIWATNSYMDSAWAWALHVTIPLTFLPAADSCPIADADVTTSGSAMAGRAVNRWQPATCTGAAQTTIDYTSSGEQQARDAFLTGQRDVALTMQPAASDPPPARTLTYAPVAADGLAIAFRTDDDVTGQPITSMKLNPRLVAKLVTESYAHQGAGTGPDANPNTLGNPVSIFSDQEFLALNPGVAWRDAGSMPLLVSDNSDMTYELTRWLDSDKAARAFLDGTPDEFGTHVNLTFKGIDYPAYTFEARDPFPNFTYRFAPVKGLENVARNLVNNQPPGVDPNADPTTGIHVKVPALLPGQRDLIAIVDTSNAAAFAFPTAQLPNASGAFTLPDAAGLTAGLAAMKPDDAGLLHADFTSTAPAAYPLTTVQYAMAPTSGLTTARAEKVGRFLDYAAGPGQVPGEGVGQLPVGYLPLPAALVDKTKAAAAAVRAQAGAPPSPSPTPAPTTPAPPGDGGVTTSPLPAGQAVPNVPGSRLDPVVVAAQAAAAAAAAQPPAPASSAPAPTGPLATPAVASRPLAPPVGVAGWVLLAVLVAGLVAAVAGPGALLAASRREAVVAWLRRRQPSRWPGLRQ